jgi:beta-lactamase class A
VRKAPAHAGGLKPWERLAFALAFALMAAFVVVVTVSAARDRERGARPAATSQPRQARGNTPPGDPSSRGSAGSPGSPGTAASQPPAVAPDRQLASALAPVLLHHTGNLAVGVIDCTTGARATYNGGRQFAAASIIASDILAVLLLRGQQAGTVFSEGELQLAAQMIETSDASAATGLWQAAGGPGGVSAANADLGLRDTTPGQGLGWGLTSTTAGDQLRLLTDLTSPHSPLTAASRSYELSLMRKAQAGQAWGVPVAATAGSFSAALNSSAALDGSLADPRLWVVSSIGVIRHAGQELLVAVLSDGQPTRSAGIAQVQAAAVAAVRQITERRS